MIGRFRTILSLAAVLMMAGGGALAANRAPMLMEGKKTLYQRILVTPGATLRATPEATDGKPLAAMSRYYVYGRVLDNGREWLEIGPNATGTISGWIGGDHALPWKQQLTLAFTNPAGRERTLLFKDRESLKSVIEAADPAAAAQPILKQVLAGKAGPGVVSVEPANQIDIAKQFYLLPVLEAEETFAGTGHRMRMLKVASVTAKADGPLKPTTKAAPETSLLQDFSAGVVFVIDSTISMGPYIDRTREAVRRIQDRIAKAGLGERVRFGLVAFRSSTQAVPQLEYVAKVFADPNTVPDGDAFLKQVADLRPASVSTPRFDEDSYAGVMKALSAIDWSGFGGRYVVLVTDAGPLRGADPLSSTRLDAEQVRLEAQHRGVALYTLHLKTPQGRDDHDAAEAQYKALSANPLVPRPLYYPVKAGSVDAFGRMVDGLAEAIVAQVNGAMKGQEVAGSATTATADKGSDLDRMQDDMKVVAHAMRLAYLGRVGDTRAPSLFSAWLSDRDPVHPDRATTEVRVLLTKNQLSDMQQVLQRIFEAGQAAQLAPQDFFKRMQSVAAMMGRDPNGVQSSRAQKLADMGLMGEYLDDLPYRSKILDVDQSLWSSWSIAQQQQFLDEIQRKLRLYRLYHDDTSRWVSLAEGDGPGAAVYPVPLDALP